jgi:eukaryotic-like serine/threonine-protein kinase
MISDTLARLSLLGTIGGPSTEEALRALSDLRTTPDQGRAIDLLLRIHARASLPEPLLLAVASELADRGEVDAAARALAETASNPGLMMRAELLRLSGDFAAASQLVERVLFRDIDWPGARERRARWATPAVIAPAPHEWADAEAESAMLPIDSAVKGDRARKRGHASFRLLREIARGGTGTVYEALDRHLDRRMAIKFYHHPDRDAAQLTHEASVATALAGEGVVRIFDVDVDEGWLAMQWCALGALNAHVTRGDPVLSAPTHRWALSLARALARVHARGWVHHDVKPANVLLFPPDASVLTDFGSARRAGDPSLPGSAGYVSPERSAGRASDPSDDVYGFGRLLEEFLARVGAKSDATSSLQALAAACTGPSGERPRDGGELLARMTEVLPV